MTTRFTEQDAPTQPVEGDPLGPTGAKIIFVDDEEKARKYFKRAFGGQHPVVTATDADVVKEQLRNHELDVAVLVADHRMPHTTGVDLLHYARDHSPETVRILTTAYADIESAVAGVNRGGIFRYIPKPWDLEEMGHALSEAHAQYRRRHHEQALLAEKRQVMLSVASLITHELRTPLLSIRLATDGLNRHLDPLFDAWEWARGHGYRDHVVMPKPSLFREAWEGIGAQLKHAQCLIDMLLTNAYHQRLLSQHSAPFRVADALREAVHWFPMTDAQLGTITIDAQYEFVLTGERILFFHLIANLLKNALYSLEVKGEGAITISVTEAGHDDVIRVRDTGLGIAPAKLPHIFDDFVSFKPSQMGIGVGLSFCRQLVEEMGGTIHCQSREGEYADFIMRFPKPGHEQTGARG